jgi:hypothetical protein
MSADEKEEGFVIRDRRGRSEGHETSSASAAPPFGAAKPEPAGPHGVDEHAHPESGLPVTFASFVFSLGTSALMLMGEQLDPQQPKIPMNLAQAKEIIDILSVLEGKTKGNLTQEEQGMLDEMLYALRMRYVALASGKPAT